MTEDDYAAPRQHLYATGGIPALQPFQPRQLITADDLNELAEAIKELDRRLQAIEAS